MAFLIPLAIIGGALKVHHDHCRREERRREQQKREVHDALNYASSRKENVQRKVQEHEKAQGEITRKNNELVSELRLIREELAAITMEKEELEEKLGMFQGELELLKENVAQDIEERNKIAQENEELSQELDAQISEKTEMEEEVKELEQKLENIKKKGDKLKEEVQKLEGENKSFVEKAEEAYEELLKDNDLLSKRYAELEKKHTDLKDDMANESLDLQKRLTILENSEMPQLGQSRVKSIEK